MLNGRSMLIESYKQISDYANTDFGDMLLDSLKREARYFQGYCEDYDRLTKPGGLR
jgi:hypothetical protein